MVDGGELRTLDSLGIAAFDLKYTDSPNTYEYGNQFKLMHKPDDHVDRVI